MLDNTENNKDKMLRSSRGTVYGIVSTASQKRRNK